MTQLEKTITYEDFKKVDIRVGKVLEVLDFPEAKVPAYKLKIDFGSEIGIKKSSAQLTKAQTKEDLLGKLVICVCNFPTKQVGPFVSEVLTLGFTHEKGNYQAFCMKDNGEINLGDRLL